MTRLERLEYDVLEHAKLPKLPDEADMKGCGFWKRAIVRVYTHTMDETFAIIRNDESSVVYEKVFGNGGVGRIVSFMPFEWYSTMLPPGVTTMDGLREFISREYGVDYSKVKDLEESKLEKLYRKYLAAKDEADRKAAAERERKSNNNKTKEDGREQAE